MPDCPLIEFRGDQSPTQCMKALSGWQTQSISMDFHELRQGFSPPIPNEKTRQHGNTHA